MKNRLNICLVDDDHIFQFTAKKMIEAIDIQNHLRIFSNGEEAITYLQQNSSASEELPDVIFLDINMPVMDGWDFLNAFGGLRPTLTKPATIYMVSSSVSEFDRRKAKECPSVHEYIYKPVSKDRFRELLASFAARTEIAEAAV